LIDSPEYKVMLPEEILKQQAHLNDSAFMKLVKRYMERYPHYIVQRVENGLAVCSRKTEYAQKRKKKR
jgi:hypothetical protein